MRRGRGPVRRGPGLLGTMARTAVVAGTATAVSGGMRRRQDSRSQDAADAAAYQQQQDYQQQQQMAQQAAAQQAAQMQPAQAQPGSSGPDVMSKLKELADMKASGMLSEDEFTAAKAKLLA